MIYRLPAICLWTVSMYLLLLLGKMLLFLSPRRRASWRGGVTWLWARGFSLIIGMEIEVRGLAPEPPFYLVSNHLSYIDIIVLFTQVKGRFVAKWDIQSWPLFGRIAASAGTIFIDRGRKADILRVNELIENALKAGDGMVVFPEGTSSKGETILPFKPSLLQYVATTGMPVRFASIHYETPAHEPPAHMAIAWWGDMTFAGHALDLLKVSKFKAVVHFGADAVCGHDRKQLAQTLWHCVVKQFVPTCPPTTLPRVAQAPIPRT